MLLFTVPYVLFTVPYAIQLHTTYANHKTTRKTPKIARGGSMRRRRTLAAGDERRQLHPLVLLGVQQCMHGGELAQRLGVPTLAELLVRFESHRVGLDDLGQLLEPSGLVRAG